MNANYLAIRDDWHTALTMTHEMTIREGYTLRYVTEGAYIAADLCCMTVGWYRDDAGHAKRSWTSLSLACSRAHRSYAQRLDTYMRA